MFQKLRHVTMMGMLFLSTTIHAQQYETYDYDNSNENWLPLNGFSLGADFLWWKVTEDNTAFAYEIDDHGLSAPVDGIFINAIDRRGKAKEFNFHYKPGVRVRFDYLLPCQGWDTCFTWTHLNSRSSRSASSPNTVDLFGGQQTLTPNFVNQSISANNVRGKLRINFNDYIWDLGKAICVTDCFNIRPFAGLQYLHIDQSYSVKTFSNNIDVFLGSYKSKIDTKYSGFGLQGGFDLNYNLGYGFNINSKFAGGITYGRARVHHKEAGVLVGSAINGEGLPFFLLELSKGKHSNSRHVTRPNLNFSIGLDWSYCFWNNYSVDLNAKWEYNHYFDQNFFSDALLLRKEHGDLALHGLVVGADFHF